MSGDELRRELEEELFSIRRSIVLEKARLGALYKEEERILRHIKRLEKSEGEEMTFE